MYLVKDRVHLEVGIPPNLKDILLLWPFVFISICSIFLSFLEKLLWEVALKCNARFLHKGPEYGDPVPESADIC